MDRNIEKVETAETYAMVDAGICGFGCRIRAWRAGDWGVTLRVTETDCGHIRKLAQEIESISIQELFAPFSQNPVYAAAQQAGCHASCTIPAAILKTAEIAMEVALPHQVVIRFKAGSGADADEEQ